MIYAATATQQKSFKPIASATEISYICLERGKRVNTNFLSGIFTKNSSSTGVWVNPLHELDKLITSFRELNYGWNGDSAKPIPETVIENSREILRVINAEPPEVYPTGRESIQFEYDTEEKSLEIEIFSDRFEVALFKQTDLLEEQSFSLRDKSIVNKYIANLHES